MSKETGKTIGILGGMGPEATIYFYQKILNFTPAQADQDHIRTLIYSNPKVPNRTQAILNNQLEATAKILGESAKILEEGGASFIVMPCNTAHLWMQDIRAAVTIPVFDMIEEAVRYLAHERQLKQVGLLATVGTIQTKVYQDKSHAFALEILVPNDAWNQRIMTVIEEVKKGHKSPALFEEIETVKMWFQEQGIFHLILGCTELPLVFEKPVDWATDPMDILAKLAVNRVLHG